MQKVAQNGTMHQKLLQYMQLALVLAQSARPDMVQGLSQDIMQTLGASAGSMASGGSPQMMERDNIAGLGKQEPTIVENAKERSGDASQPDGGRVIGRNSGK